MEVRLKTIRKKTRRCKLFRSMVSNGMGCFADTQRERQHRKRDFRITFEINSKHFISLTCEKASRICLFRRNQFEQFPCDRVCTKKFKTTSKNGFRRYFSLTLSVLCICWRKQLKLKNYTRRLRWYWEAINLCGCALALACSLSSHTTPNTL